MKLKLIITIILSFILVGVSLAATSAKGIKEQLLEQIVDKEVLKEIEKQSKDVENFSKILETIKGVDPTRPEKRAVEVVVEEDEELEPGEEPKIQPISLTAIFVSGKTKFAVINGRIVAEGDVVNDRTVKKINKNKVVIQDFDAVKELSLPKAKIRTKLEPKTKKENGNGH